MEMPDKNAMKRWEAGSAYDAWRFLGSHRAEGGVSFAVWAPCARRVRVTGDFCGWSGGAELGRADGGVWTGLIPEAQEGSLYKYIVTGSDGAERWKADPFAVCAELRPGTASRVHTLAHDWRDGAWMAARRPLGEPRNIYEVHAGSWRRRADGSFLSWTELADQLVPYVRDMGFTHIELLPVMEHPLDASWGYQVTGYYAATSRYGEPEGLMELVDRCHENGIGVILDWVPAHFCRDDHGLGRFDGGALFEGGDLPEWGTYKFNYASPQVRAFLVGSALFWLREYHADGIRVDGVSSMLYLNYGVDDPARKVHNRNGGEENLEAVAFLQELNAAVGREVPGAFTVAEESTAWPLVTYPPDKGGLGFHYKWDMGWMNDTLRYMETDFLWRRDHHNELTFSMMYAYSENYILPLSHDEVVHGKRSLIGRMPGDWWRQFAGMRLLRLYSLCHPGGKLLFMGGEFAQFIEWREYEALEWFLLDYPTHAAYRDFSRAANALYRREKALWEQDNGWEGFRWQDADNCGQSVLVFRRRAKDGTELLCVLHFMPETHRKWRLGVPEAGVYEEIFSTDDAAWGGSGQTNRRALRSEPVPWHGEQQSIVITVPPLGGALFKKKAGTGQHGIGKR